MSTTIQPRKAVTDVAQPQDDGTFVRRSWNYGYIGEDAKGRHHHIDRKLERIVVTTETYGENLPASAAAPRYTVKGPILHAEACADNDVLRQWIEHVNDVVGWNDRPISAVDTLRGVF